MTPETLYDRFVRGALDNRSFDHRAHLCIGWEALRRAPFEAAEAAVCDGIRRLAENGGTPKKFHRTLTAAFMRLIAARRHGAEAEDFEAFLAANADLLERPRDVLAHYYSDATLFSDRARSAWVAPDRAPFPPVAKAA